MTTFLRRLWTVLWTDVEAKVKAASTTAALTGALLGVLADVFGTSLPSWVAPAAGLLVPGVLTWLAGWMARHTPRPTSWLQYRNAEHQRMAKAMADWNLARFGRTAVLPPTSQGAADPQRVLDSEPHGLDRPPHHDEHATAAPPDFDG